MDPAAGSALMRLSDLQDSRVRTLDGEALGRVHELHVEHGRVTALTCGPGSLIERLTAKKHGRRIPWECVRRISPKEVVVDPDPPQRKSRSDASRSPRGTRRPNAPPSQR